MSVAVLEVRYWDKPSDRHYSVVTSGVLEQDWELIKKVGRPVACLNGTKMWFWRNPLDNHLEYQVLELGDINSNTFISVSVGREQRQLSLSFKDGSRVSLEEYEGIPKMSECILYDKDGNEVSRYARSKNMIGVWGFRGSGPCTNNLIRVYEEPELPINTDFEYHANTMIELLKEVQ